MGKLTVTTRVDAPPEAVFDYVDHYRNTTRYMRDLTLWEPVGRQNQGRGARFDVEIVLGGRKLRSRAVIETWRRPHSLHWTSESGFSQSGGWEFEADGARTAVTFTLEWNLGLALAVFAKAAEPLVKRSLDESLARLKANVEGQHGGHPTPRRRRSPATR